MSTVNFDSQIRSVSLFFYFALMDDVAAQRAAVKTMRLCQKRIRKNQVVAGALDSNVVHCTSSIWNKIKNRLSAHLGTVPNSDQFQLPLNVELGPWRQFKKEAEDDEFLAVLWSRVMKISDTHIATGLGISEGTLRHRVNRGLRILGRKRQYGGFDE